MTQPLPVVRGSYPHVGAVARALSLNPSLIENTGLPVETVFNGIAAMIVPVASRAAIESIEVDTNALKKISNEVDASTVLVFARDPLVPTNTVHCRVFAPAAGVTEDAATGSANGALGFYIVQHKLLPAARTITIVSEQGYEMKRPSQLYVEVDTNLDMSEAIGVRVGGGVVIAGRGEIFVG
jgi:trans-2,3-dihydro-3-hydroxyanthranilate isomerase